MYLLFWYAAEVPEIPEQEIEVGNGCVSLGVSNIYLRFYFGRWVVAGKDIVGLDGPFSYFRQVFAGITIGIAYPCEFPEKHPDAVGEEPAWFFQQEKAEWEYNNEDKCGCDIEHPFIAGLGETGEIKAAVYGIKVAGGAAGVAAHKAMAAREVYLVFISAAAMLHLAEYVLIGEPVDAENDFVDPGSV